MARSRMELEVLRVEAERRVRAGQSRAEVSRVLGVAPMTLAGWALRYGWRQKDLEAERSPQAAEAAMERIRQARISEAEARKEAAERQAACREEVGRLEREERVAVRRRLDEILERNDALVRAEREREAREGEAGQREAGQKGEG